MTNREIAEAELLRDFPRFLEEDEIAVLRRALDKAQMRPTEGQTPRVDAIISDPMTEREGIIFFHARQLERELAACEASAYERSKTSPVARLHNICDALQYDKENSPYSAESWDELVAENDSLRKQLAALSTAPVEPIWEQLAAIGASAPEGTWDRIPRVDRGEAVNLARNWLDSQGPNAGMHITTKGIRTLAEAVMNMDAALLSPSPVDTGWIPVSERLPKDDQRVLVSGGTTLYDPCIARHKYQTGSGGHWSYEPGFVAPNPTHWMPLPAPPEAPVEKEKL